MARKRKKSKNIRAKVRDFIINNRSEWDSILSLHCNRFIAKLNKAMERQFNKITAGSHNEKLTRKFRKYIINKGGYIRGSEWGAKQQTSVSGEAMITKPKFVLSGILKKQIASSFFDGTLAMIDLDWKEIMDSNSINIANSSSANSHGLSLNKLIKIPPAFDNKGKEYQKLITGLMEDVKKRI